MCSKIDCAHTGIYCIFINNISFVFCLVCLVFCYIYFLQLALPITIYVVCVLIFSWCKCCYCRLLHLYTKRNLFVQFIDKLISAALRRRMIAKNCKTNEINDSFSDFYMNDFCWHWSELFCLARATVSVEEKLTIVLIMYSPSCT